MFHISIEQYNVVYGVQVAALTTVDDLRSAVLAKLRDRAKVSPAPDSVAIMHPDHTIQLSLADEMYEVPQAVLMMVHSDGAKRRQRTMTSHNLWHLRDSTSQAMQDTVFKPSSQSGNIVTQNRKITFCR